MINGTIAIGSLYQQLVRRNLQRLDGPLIAHVHMMALFAANPATKPSCSPWAIRYIHRLCSSSASSSPVTAKSMPAGDDWLHEPKLDGYCVQIAKHGRVMRLYSRRGQDRKSVV